MDDMICKRVGTSCISFHFVERVVELVDGLEEQVARACEDVLVLLWIPL